MSATTYLIRISHQGLGAYRTIKAHDKDHAQAEAQAQLAEWATAWNRRLFEWFKVLREPAMNTNAVARAVALKATQAMQREVEACDRILTFALSRDNRIDFSILKSDGMLELEEPAAPEFKPYPIEPLRSDPEFAPTLGLLERWSSSRRAERIHELDAAFAVAHTQWSALREDLDRENTVMRQKYEQETTAWRAAIDQYSDSIDTFHAGYMNCEAQEVERYCALVLSRSSYPGWLNKNIEVNFDARGIVVVDFELPVPSDLPNIKEVKYVATRDSFENVLFPSHASAARYDSVIYQICLRVIHELYSSDGCDAIHSAVFNGWTEYTNPTNGQMVRACILSLQMTKQEYDKLHLESVDPKACFRALRGTGAAQLHGMVPIQPILSLKRDDSRFVPSLDVASRLKEGTNLATLGWEEFEHLIQQIFEKEYSRDGSEVKVTQSSRDGGVDAVVFDPDPIHGGKIVIQAKRYTNTVGVSAVRDLYGTILNEGASKGILVTTSSFGLDAYAFAKNKPLTLLDGANLVYLLEKHGYHARVDLDEAKALGVSMHRFAESSSQSADLPPS